MKSRVLKKNIQELASIIITKGYWSNEVKEYLSNYEYSAMTKLNNKAKALAKN